MYKIEKGIPIPTVGTRRKFPFAEMKIGDSFFISQIEGETNSVRSTACYYARRNPGYKFRVKRVEGGTRVWRVQQ